MKKTRTELAYLQATAENATSVGLVIILYDLLTADLERAIAAMAERDVEKRSSEINHAFLVLQQLEGSLDMGKGGDAATNLSRFYSAIRGKVLEAQVKVSAEILREQIELILQVRRAWQQVDTAEVRAASATAGSLSSPPPEQQVAAAGFTDGPAVSADWTV